MNLKIRQNFDSAISCVVGISVIKLLKATFMALTGQFLENISVKKKL